MNNQGDPLNLTISRLRLMAQRNNSTPVEQAKIILATVLGYINQRQPLGNDEITIDVKRTTREAATEAKYVPRKNG